LEKAKADPSLALEDDSTQDRAMIAPERISKAVN
jgi:hypothetical protein